MRVTDAMRVDQLLADLDRVRVRLARLQDQAASGRRVRRPSDDPVVAGSAMYLRARLGEIERFLASAQQASDWLEATDAALGSAQDVLARARELAVTGASDTLPAEARQALAAEVDALIDALIQVGNTSLDGRYLFGGHRTTQPPFTRSGSSATYNGDGGAVRRAIGVGVAVTVNVPGDQAFAAAFAALSDLYQRLTGNDAQGISATTLPLLDQAIDGLLRVRAQVGANAERVRREESRLRAAQVEAVRILSETEDADLAETVLRLNEAEAAYRAALAVGARIIQPTLIDFLR